ncbi:MAG: hypothetical protein IKA88_03365 [Clostridia bacterium]|nr:hypothetical protein [Clostridia bacterium]
MKRFCFTVDDNVWFLRDLTRENYTSIFEHPYLAVYKRLHEKYGLKVQLNLFFWTEGFALSEMTDKFRKEWEENADWLKFSFHSLKEEKTSYEKCSYQETYSEVSAVHESIKRFAGETTLAKTTTVHFCLGSQGAVKALGDCGMQGLLGLFGTKDDPHTSYGLEEAYAKIARNGGVAYKDGMAFAPIDVILNLNSPQENVRELEALIDREEIHIMIHEQYFYPYYTAYQPDFEEKVESAVVFLQNQGYTSCFFEEML